MKLGTDIFLKLKDVPASKRILTITRITILKYPKTITFYTTIRLPKFQYGSQLRTKIAHQVLKNVKYSIFHEPTDFVVEKADVSLYSRRETWHLGS